MKISFQEKSIWISLITTVLVFGYYFTNAFIRVVNDDGLVIRLFVAVVVLAVIVKVVLHIVLSVAYRKQAKKGEDERDKLIELKATRISYFILVFGVWITSISMLMTASSLMLANIIMFFFILSEIVGFTTQLFYYRKGF